MLEPQDTALDPVLDDGRNSVRVIERADEDTDIQWLRIIEVHWRTRNHATNNGCGGGHDQTACDPKRMEINDAPRSHS